MRKPIEDKSPLAAWATLARDEAGMSVEEVVDALGERGHVVRAATIRGIEGGSKGASVRLRRLLAEVYGTKPPGVPLERPTSADVVAQALLVQAAAMGELVAEMRELVSELRLARGSLLASRIEAIESFAAQSGYLPPAGPELEDATGRESRTEAGRPAALRR